MLYVLLSMKSLTIISLTNILFVFDSFYSNIGLHYLCLIMKIQNRILIALLFLVGAIGVLNAKGKNEMRVGSYNLRMNTPRDGENAWPKRSANVAALLEYHDLDIFGTQEAFKEMLEDVVKADPQYAYTGKGREDGIEGGEHSAIMYKKDRFKLLDSGDFWYSETPDVPAKGWDATCCNRICSWGKFKDLKNGKIFFFFNSHFDHEGKVARRESSKLMLKKIKEIAGKMPVIATGDFNADPTDEPIQVILADGLLKDSYAISATKPYGPVGTFQNFQIDSPLANRIDFVFVTDGIKVNKYGVLTDSRNGRFPSDHCPVVVDVTF